MKLKSLISQGWDLYPIEVEVLLLRGLPELKFIGLPDQAIRESAIRIKTAIKQSGFSWPEADQIVVNLKPNHLKKSSRGLELAVAAGILWETEQLPIPRSVKNWTLYGELNLDGKIQQPEDLMGLEDRDHQILITGEFPSSQSRPWLEGPVGVISHLRELNEPQWETTPARPTFEGPSFDHIRLTPQQAQLARIVAWGRHPLLMAGPAGSGKSMMAQLIHGLGSDPDLKMQKHIWRQGQKNLKDIKDERLWRPLIHPHHTITVQGLIGGGQWIRPGELARAHHGTLLLDELLEFKAPVIESLREPLETQRIRLARASGYYTYECDFHLIATTNLCPCGDFVPKVPTRCRFSLTRCRSYSQKLTGPLVDRFQVLTFSHQWKSERTVAFADIQTELKEKRGSLSDQAPSKTNARRTEADFSVDQWPFLERKLLEKIKGSHRRYLSSLRVAQSLAELRGKKYPQAEDLETSLEYTLTPFVDLQRWD